MATVDLLNNEDDDVVDKLVGAGWRFENKGSYVELTNEDLPEKYLHIPKADLVVFSKALIKMKDLDWV